MIVCSFQKHVNRDLQGAWFLASQVQEGSSECLILVRLPSPVGMGKCESHMPREQKWRLSRRFDMMEDLMALHRVCCHQAWPEQSVRIRQCIHKGRGGSPSPCSTLISFQVAVALICGRSRTQLLQSRTINEVSTLYYTSKSIKG